MEREQQARLYARLRRILWLIECLLTAAFSLGILLSGIASNLEFWTVEQVANPWLQVVVYVAILWMIFRVLIFPLEWFSSFWLEHRFQLSTQNFKQWLWEYTKQFLVGSILGLAVVLGLAALLNYQPSTWWAWAAVFWLFWSVILTQLAPTLLIPLFYKQKPLDQETVRQRLEQLLQQCGARVNGIFEINLSKTTKKANACLCGMGQTRRVLISDTMLESYPTEEIEVVLAHEVGHHQLHHLWISILVSAVATGLSCYGVDRWAQGLMERLGIFSLSSLAALPLIGLGLWVASLILMPVTNGLSRILETQADRYALERTQNKSAFITTMQRLAEQNLAEINPPRWVEWLFYDHPAIGRRIAMADRFGAAKS